jgi:hypothetical protein
MISLREAETKILAHLRNLSETYGVDLTLMKDATIEIDFGWVFFYDSKAYLKSERYRDRLAGNGPIIVDKERFFAWDRDS